MKSLHVTAWVIAAFVLWSGTASAATLVGHWSLNETSGNTAVDSVGGNNGAWQNGVSTNLARPDGVLGVSADLSDAGGNAADNYFQINNINQFIGADGISLSAWVDPNAQANSGYNGIFMTRDFNGQTGNSWGIAIENSGGEHLDSRVDGPGIDSPGGSLSSSNGWHHVVLTYDANTKTHTQYINGEQTNTVSVAGDPQLDATLNGPSGPWFIGFDNCCGDSRDFDGRIDDVSAWTGALSATEVSQIYSAGLQKAEASQALGFVAPTAGAIQNGLVAHWSMDQVAGTQHAGESINRSHAGLNGMDPNTDWVAGQIGNALQFDGGNDQAIVSGQRSADLNAATNGTSALTMSIWVRSDGPNNNNEGLFEHRGPGNSNLTGFNTPSAGTNNFDFRIVNTSIKSDDNTLVEGEWTLLTGVWEAGVRHELYINGELAVSNGGSIFAGGLVAVGDWRFGNDTCCGNRFFNGALDDAGIWTRALSAQEIAVIYQQGLNGVNLAQANVPEPTTFVALSLGGLALLRRRRSAA